MAAPLFAGKNIADPIPEIPGGVRSASVLLNSALRHSMATPSISPLTITPLRRKGRRETRLLTVSAASANSSGGMGKYWVADMGILYRLSRGKDKESHYGRRDPGNESNQISDRETTFQNGNCVCFVLMEHQELPKAEV